MKKYIVSLSGGLGSAWALKSAIEKHGKENLIVLFSDVKGTGKSHQFGYPTVEELLYERYGGESRDTYKFIWELSYYFDIPIERLESHKTVFSVAYEKKAITLRVKGHNYCFSSKELKADKIKDYIVNNFSKDDEIIMYLGMDKFYEAHRIEKSRNNWKNALPNYNLLIDSLNEIANCDLLKWFVDNDFSVPKAYFENKSHNNCNSICLLASNSNYINIYRSDIELFRYIQHIERELRKSGIKNTILRKQAFKKPSYPISLDDFEQMYNNGELLYYEYDGYSSCSCMTGQGELL